MSMASDIARYLADNGFGSTTTNPPTIMSNVMSSQPDNVISAFDQSGFEPERAMGRVDHEVRNLQILVRNVLPASGELVARNVWKFLDMKVDVVINGTLYKCILARTPAFSMGKDENGRHLWSCNYVVRKAVTA